MNFKSFKFLKQLEIVVLAVLGAAHLPIVGDYVMNYLTATYFGIAGLIGIVLGALAILGALMIYQKDL